MKLVFAPQAAAEIETASRWWAANRPAAPRLLEAELATALALITATPSAGAPMRSQQHGAIRRILLPRCRYLLYYRVAESNLELRVLRFWHASRRAPRIPK